MPNWPLTTRAPGRTTNEICCGLKHLRPSDVIQANKYNQSERHLIVAEITSNLSRAADSANLLIEITTPEGQATGLAQDSLATCLQLATISENRVSAVIGKLSAPMLVKLNDCLKVTLEIP